MASLSCPLLLLDDPPDPPRSRLPNWIHVDVGSIHAYGGDVLHGIPGGSGGLRRCLSTQVDLGSASDPVPNWLLHLRLLVHAQVETLLLES